MNEVMKKGEEGACYTLYLAKRRMGAGKDINHDECNTSQLAQLGRAARDSAI